MQPKHDKLQARVPEPEASTTLIYIGPPEQESPALGPLVAGRRYQVAADLAAYLVSTHSDYWQAAPIQAVADPGRDS